ncbi:MAG: hypothetical protein IPN53_06540 [Comamonadaceae bacterium]|nr:hypothetical protein [Comamonadaceae bacterium]
MRRSQLPDSAECGIIAQVDVQMPVQFILDDLGGIAPGQFVVFVKAVPGELDALALPFVEFSVHLSLHHSELEVAVQILPEGYVARHLTARGRGWQ